MSTLRIGLVCPYSLAVPGGVQNHVLGLAGWLATHGQQVRVLAPGHAPEAVLRRHGLDPEWVSSAGDAVPIAYNGSTARINFGPRTALRCRRWLATTEPDLVHLHEPVTPSAALLTLWAARVPVIATFHAATPRSLALALAGRALSRSIARIDTAIAVSPTARQVVRDHLGLDPEVISNGFRFTDFATGTREPAAGIQQGRDAASSVEPPRPETAEEARPRVVFLGRMDEPRKGLQVFLDAVPEIRRAAPQARFLVAGPGRRTLPAGVERLGVLNDTERVEFLRSAAVFVAPHTGRESFGLVLAEAMAAGTPVVASQLPAFLDVLTASDGRLLGRTFRVGDSAALAREVLEALARPDPELVTAAAQHVRRYDWDEVAAAVLACYRAVLGDATGRDTHTPSHDMGAGAG